MATTYMTVKLNLPDGTIIYPQVSLDNIVKSIGDPTLVSIATTTGGKVPTTELPTVTSVREAASASDTVIPTEKAVAAAVASAGGLSSVTIGSGLDYNQTNNTLSVSGVPMSSVTGLSTALSGKQATMIAGIGTSITGGNTINVTSIPQSAVIDLATDLIVLSGRIDAIASLPEGSTSGDAELMDIRIGIDGTSYSTAGDAVRGQVDDIYDLIDDYASGNPIPLTKDFQFAQGRVSAGHVIDPTNQYAAYVDYNDDSVTSISFDATKYKINLYAYQGANYQQVIYTAWITESPYTIPVIGAHDIIGINVQPLSGKVDVADVQASVVFHAVGENPFATKTWVDAKGDATLSETGKFADAKAVGDALADIDVTNGVRKFKGVKVPYPSEFDSRLKPQIYKSPGGRYYADYNLESLKVSGSTEVWISPDGNDSNAGTEASPKKTLTAAISSGAVTIYMKEGTYNYTNGCLSSSNNIAGHNLIGIGNVLIDRTDGQTNQWTYCGSGNCYVENINFKGKTYGMFTRVDASNTVTLYKCTCSNTDGGFYFQGGNIWVIDCIVHDVNEDGFNYHMNDQLTENNLPSVVQIDCIAYNCGDGTRDSDNCTTIHDGGSIVRVNGEFYNSHGGILADISPSSSKRTHSCNFGVCCHNSTNNTEGKEHFNACFWSTMYTYMWLFDCVAWGSTYEISCYQNATVWAYSLMSDNVFNPTDCSAPADTALGTGTIVRKP